jgi:small-conductance mechanosensitive channel
VKKPLKWWLTLASALLIITMFVMLIGALVGLSLEPAIAVLVLAGVALVLVRAWRAMLS